jgi:DNA polymerase I
MSSSSANYISDGAETLFGLDPTTGLIAVEADDPEGVLLYRRTADGVRRERAPFKPWILLTERPAEALSGAAYTDLEGTGYSVLAEFPTYATYRVARFEVQNRHLHSLTYPTGAKMAMIRSGQTLFKGMTFEDVVRMQVDIETDGLDPNPASNRILMIAVSDNRGLLDILEGDEPDLLDQLIALVADRDPDIIEGHNLFGFDLPFLIARARRHGIALTLGRDGSELRQGQERNYAIGGNSRPFTPAYVHGRHIIDTYLVVQRFDWAKGALSSYGLKECARHFGFAVEERIELPGAEIARFYREQPELVREYARQDAVETRKLAELITPIEFYQTQMVPDNYGQVTVTGTGEKINSMFVRAYLAAGRAVSRPRESRPYPGGYTEVRLTGVLDHVVKADVESLYPNLMLTHGIAPETDTLGVFLPALRDLTTRRMEAKRRAQEAEPSVLPPADGLLEEPRSEPNPPASSDAPENASIQETVIPRSKFNLQNSSDPATSAQYWDGLQGSFKVLINSFYGYLGGPFCWNDYNAAGRVTELGRELVQRIASDLEGTGSRVIEIDTDGVYFVPPESIRGESAERSYVEHIGRSLRDGIRLAFDGRFKRMLSLKTKNYVLETPEGRKIFKGASLRSRADERYGRHFLAKAIDCLLEHDLQGAADLYAATIEDLLQRRVPISDLARRERVTEKTFQSEQKRRSAAVAEGVAIGEHVMVYERLDGSLGLLGAYRNDENPKYYMEKLYKFARRLEEGFDGQFEALIPKPTAQGLPQQHQTTLDLFE